MIRQKGFVPIWAVIAYLLIKRHHGNLESLRDDEEDNLNSAGLVFTIENKDNQLRPQMNAECAVVLESRQNVLSVPREAVHGKGTSLT